VVGLDLDAARIAEARAAASGWPASFTVADLSTAEVPACDTALILDVLLLMPDAAQLASWAAWPPPPGSACSSVPSTPIAAGARASARGWRNGACATGATAAPSGRCRCATSPRRWRRQASPRAWRRAGAGRRCPT
jgi:hypothetical protein